MKKTFLFLIIALAATLGAQSAYDGYTLFSPNGSHNTYLIDMSGTTVHSWYSSNTGGYSSYLLENGLLLRPVEANNTVLNGAAKSGRFEKQDWNGNIVWQYDYHGSTYLPHHDIEPMPNGNILIVSWEVKTGAQALAAGRSTSVTMWPDYIVEIEPSGSNGGTVVWEWHFWDHLIQDHDPTKANYGVVEDHPELLDINLGNLGGGPGGGGGDWNHINGIDYNPILDQIVISSHNMDEIYVIDHSTTTAEAASHSGGNSGMGGDILYRWGKAANYGATGSYTINVVHCAYWVPANCPGAGNLMAFNNNEGTNQSKVFEIEPPYLNTYNYSWTPGTAFAPSQPVWQYTNGTAFYSNHLGSVQRLPNGNTLICKSTSGYMFEVDANGSILWDKDTSYQIARCLRYAPDYSGLAQLFPNGLLNGTVLDGSTSEPIQNAVITIGSNTITTDSSGFYEITLPAGIYQLSCEHPDYQPYSHPNDVIIVENQTTTINFSLTPLIALGAVEGVITNSQTFNPVNNATIIMDIYETQSDENGYYHLELPAGIYQLCCQHPAYEPYTYPDSISVPENQTVNVDFSLTPLPETGTVTGTVTDIITSAPVENAVLNFGEYQTQSNSGGLFYLELPAGDYQLTVTHPDYQDYIYPETVEIITGQIAEIEIFLTPLVGTDDDPLLNGNMLLGNYPNPFNSATTIRLQLSPDYGSEVKLEIYNLKGQKVKTLPIFSSQGPTVSIIWDGTDEMNEPVPSGIYLYKLNAGNYSSTRKMILLK